jgi:peptide/nickel transport system permease protein
VAEHSTLPIPLSRAVPAGWFLSNVKPGVTVQGFLRAAQTPIGGAGAVSLLLLASVAILAPVVSPYNPLEQHPGHELLGPGSPGFVLGTDQFGRDMLSRLMWGARTSFLVAIIAVSVGTTAGVTLGLSAGYFSGLLDTLLMRVCDMILSFPGILVAIAVVSVLGPGSINVAWALSVGLVPGLARLTRSSVLRERENQYVLAARCCGASDLRMMWVHIFPNTVGPLLVQVSLALGFTVLAEAGLSFLGLGTQPPDASWGAMLNDSRAYLRQAPWYGIWPGLALAVLVFGLNAYSDALRDALDPQRVNRR